MLRHEPGACPSLCNADEGLRAETGPQTAERIEREGQVKNAPSSRSASAFADRSPRLESDDVSVTNREPRVTGLRQSPRKSPSRAKEPWRSGVERASCRSVELAGRLRPALGRRNWARGHCQGSALGSRSAHSSFGAPLLRPEGCGESALGREPVFWASLNGTPPRGSGRWTAWARGLDLGCPIGPGAVASRESEGST